MNMLSYKWLLPFGILIAIVCVPAFAAGCNQIGTQNVYVNAGVYPTDNSSPIGTVIASKTYRQASSDFLASCQAPHSIQYKMFYGRKSSTVGGDVYNTNVPGIGIRASISRENATNPPRVYNRNYAKNYEYVDVTVTLIKTGNMSPGALKTGDIAYLDFSKTANGVFINGVKVIMRSGGFYTPTCSVNTKNISVPLGTHYRKELSGVGSTTDKKKFNISLSCQYRAVVQMKLDAVADNAGGPGVIALSPDKGSATGVGVQVLHSTGTDPMTLGQEYLYSNSADSGNFNIDMYARYYQTGNIVTPGSANAMATFTMNYK